MNLYIGMAVSVILEILTDKGILTRYAPKIAKVYVRIEEAIAFNPTLAAEIEKQRQH